MDRFALLEALTTALDWTLPDVVAARCVAGRYRASTCRRCQDVCPADAITLDPSLAVDPEVCVSCGVCAAVCRTGALDFGERRASLRRQAVDAVRGGQTSVRIACSAAGETTMPDISADRSMEVGGMQGQGTLASRQRKQAPPAPAPEDGHALPVPAALAGLLRVVCLGSLSAGELVGLCAAGVTAVELVRPSCAGCPFERAVGALETSVMAARAALTTMGLDLAVSWRQVPQAPAANPRPPQPPAPPLSRRDLFSFFAGAARRTAATVLPDWRPPIEALHAQTPPPPSHRVLVEDVAHLSQRGSGSKAPVDDGSGGACLWPSDRLPETLIDAMREALPLGRVLISDACDECGLCARYCPHGALKVSGELTDGRHASARGSMARTVTIEQRPSDGLSFEPELCTACGLCVEVCPRQALTLQSALEPPSPQL